MVVECQCPEICLEKNDLKNRRLKKVEGYQAAKRASNLAVRLAKKEAEKDVFKIFNPRSVEVYQMAKKMRRGR